MGSSATTVTTGVVWDLTSFFPKFGGPEMEAFKAQLKQDIAALQELAASLDPLGASNQDQWEALILRDEDMSTRLGHLWSYIGCLGAADAANEEYVKEEGHLSRLGAESQKIDVDILRGFKDATDADFQTFLARPKLAGAEFALQRTRERAQKTMSREQEMLAADLGVDGFHAWGRVYDTITGKLEFDMAFPDGRQERLPISRWRSLMSDADREVGRAAFECGNRAWKSLEDVCAAALNAISGTRLTLYKYRGISHFLDRPLFQSAVNLKTLEAMYEAIYHEIEIPRRIFKVKAQALGRTGIGWYERESPLPLSDASRYNWTQGVAMVEQAFKQAYPKLGEYYLGFLNQHWMESEPRKGKRPGAFCTGSDYTREQRVFMTFDGSLSDVTTMAHELGHAYHSHVMKELRPLAQGVPMTLAETASIFGEHILADGIFKDPAIGDTQKLLMLDAELCGAATLLLDITVRFEFEKAFHEERSASELGVSRFKELMVATQQRVMGDTLLPGLEDPMFWASKLHFYITGAPFYNFPYTFGFLLARALYGLFRKEGPAFLPRYEEFLRLTGSDTVEGVAKRSLGADVSDPAFWTASIRSLAEPLSRYEALLSKLDLAKS